MDDIFIRKSVFGCFDMRMKIMFDRLDDMCFDIDRVILIK